MIQLPLVTFDVCLGDLHEFDYLSTTGHVLDYAMMDLVDNLPPSIVKDKPHAFNEVIGVITIGLNESCCPYTLWVVLRMTFIWESSLVVVMMACLTVPTIE